MSPSKTRSRKTLEKFSFGSEKNRSVGIFRELLTISLLEVHVVYTKNIERRSLKFELRKVVRYEQNWQALFIGKEFEIMTQAFFRQYNMPCSKTNLKYSARNKKVLVEVSVINIYC